MVTSNANDFTSIIDQVAAGIAKLDTNGRFISANQVYCEMLGYTQKALLGLSFEQITKPLEFSSLKRKFDELVAGECKNIRIKNQVITQSGKPLTVYLSATLVSTPEPTVVFVVQDIEQMAQQDDSFQLASMAMTHSGNGILITDANDTIIQVNPAFCRISGFQQDEIVGRKPFLLRSGEHDESFYNRIWKTLAQDGFWQGEICYRHKSGGLFYVWESISAVVNRSGETINYVSNMADMTELKRQQQALDDLANYDALTELPNRHYFNANLTQAIEMSKRHDTKVALLFIDLNKFKPINDQFGHKAGDNLLAEVANRLSKSVRKEDTAARIGGDEFVVLMPRVMERDLLESVAERLLESLQKPIAIKSDLEISISASIGVSIYPDDINRLENNNRNLGQSRDSEIIELADQAMYAAKEHELPLCFFDQIHHFSPITRVAVS